MPTKNITAIKVLTVKAKGEPRFVAGKAFNQLEKITGLKGRKMYGVYFKDKNEYWACTAIEVDDDLAKMGLEQEIIPGGLYAYSILKGKYNEIVQQVGETMDQLVKENDNRIDWSRPPVEYYFRFNEFILMVPIKSLNVDNSNVPIQ
ncbi:MAG TPA: GyrI-like domain-containing protein [Patescibacteria group bacterium]|nr:GyrI-like domain-containing protein [Patescibacteria group bacterium]